MVIYDLVCEFEHEFEGWFKNQEDLQMQQSSGLLCCPVCGSTNVIKKPTAAKLTKKSNTIQKQQPQQNFIAADAQENSDFEHVQQLLSHVHDYIDQNFQDVGNQFAEKATQMHEGEQEIANIKGTASQKELQELHESGVPVLPVPPKPIDKKKLN